MEVSKFPIQFCHLANIQLLYPLLYIYSLEQATECTVQIPSLEQLKNAFISFILITFCHTPGFCHNYTIFYLLLRQQLILGRYCRLILISYFIKYAIINPVFKFLFWVEQHWHFFSSVFTFHSMFSASQFQSARKTRNILICEIIFTDDTAFVAHNQQNAQKIITYFSKSEN